MTSSGNDEKWIEKLRDHFDGEEETKRQLRETSLQEGRYLLENRIGEGAFAVVYRALDRKLSRPVAVKVLREQAAANDVIRKRFLREARAIGKISHPNVVSVHDVGEEGPQMYLVMELVEGKTLQHLFEKGRGEIRSRVKLLEQVSRGLAVAHAQGVVHRDVKPANILLTPEGVPKIADFGLAHLRNSRTLLTDSGATMGTPAYMSPEQVQGRIGEIGPQTDVYALGMVLYEILTGVLAYEGNTPVELYNRIVEEDPVRPRKITSSAPEDLETICLKALSKERDRRYANATAFADDLRRWIDGEPIEARPASWIYRIRRKVAKRKALAISLAASAVIVTGILALVLPRVQKAEREKEEILTAQQKKEEAGKRAMDLLIQGEALLQKKRFHSGIVDPGEDVQTRDALKLFDQAIELAPELALAYSKRALARWKMGDFEGAIQDFTKTIDLDSELAIGDYYNRARVRFDMGDLDNAIADYTQAIKLNPEYARAYNDRGCVWRDKKAFDIAIADYTKAIEIDPAYAVAYGNRGSAWYFKGDLDKAIEDHTKAIEIDPGFVIAYRNRGDARYLKRDLCGAIEDYTMAVKLRPGDSEAYSNRGTVRHSKGDLKGAIEDYTKAIELNPNDPIVYINLGFVRQKQGDHDGAIVDYTQAIKLDPENADAYKHRGLAHLHKRNLDRAIVNFTKAIELDPKNGITHSNRGAARLMKGDLDGAIEDFTKAIRFNVSKEINYYLRGDARYRKKDLEGAIADIRKALEVASPNWGIRKKAEGTLERMQEERRKENEE